MRLWLIVLAASMAVGQTPRVFQLAQKETPEDLAEIATVLRSTGDIKQVTVDAAKDTVTVDGTAEQIALAEWLIGKLDVPAKGPFTGVLEFRAPRGDDVTGVLYAANAATPVDLQEIATTLRSVADVRRLFVYNARKAVVARDTGPKILLSAWLMDQLNQPAKAVPTGVQEYKLPGDDVARVFYLASPHTPQELQEIVTLIRSVGEVQRLFVNNARHAIAMRAPAERIALADWLVSKLDRPSHEGSGPDSYTALTGSWNAVRIFYLPEKLSPEERQKAVSQVRTNAGTQRMFVYNKLAALAVRGTASQVETAQKALEEMKLQ